MKRFFAVMVVISLVFTSIMTVGANKVFGADFDSQEALRIYRNTKFADITTPSYVVYDFDNSQVIAQKNKDDKRPCASLVKLMTVYIAYEYISLGKIKIDDMIVTSANAAAAEGTTAFISSGDSFSVGNALYAIIISSCNDVTVALAEHIAGSEQEFVKLMNLHAAGLGMENTNFVDCTGISDKSYTTAYDMSLLTYAIISKHPEYLEISKINYDLTTFKNGTGPFYMYNTNKFLKFVPDSEGLKIGNTTGADYCISATYVVDGRRFIAVFLGASDENVLYAETRRAFDYCFANYFYTNIQEDGEFVTDIKVTKGVEKSVGCEIEGEFSKVISAADKQAIEKKTNLPESLEAPVAKGDKIGNVEYVLNGEVIYELDIIASDDVERANWFQIFIQWLLEWFGFA